MKTGKRGGLPLWIAAGILLLAGMLLFVADAGCEAFALVCWGAAAAVIAYRLLALWAKKRPKPAKILKICLTVCLCAAFAAVSVTGGVLAAASGGQPDRDCTYAVVLGAGVNGSEPSRSLRERIDAAYAYLTAHPDTVCVVSGCRGRGEDLSEAACIRRELVNMGVASERIWLEEQAENTRQNIRYSLDVIEAQTGQRPAEIALISSEYHLYRATWFARQEGVTAYGVPAHTGNFGILLNFSLREIAAVWYYCVLGG